VCVPNIIVIVVRLTRNQLANRPKSHAANTYPIQERRSQTINKIEFACRFLSQKSSTIFNFEQQNRFFILSVFFK
jgi:hypothetical protein